jgi:hypothetical protein
MYTLYKLQYLSIHKAFYVFSSRCLATALKLHIPLLPCSRPYRLATVSQLTHDGN